MTTIDQPIEKTKARPTTRKPPLYKILVHNDPVSTGKFVLLVLMTVFKKTEEDGWKIALEAHETGAALVEVMTLELAEFRVDQAMSMAKASKFPLKFSIEPD